MKVKFLGKTYDVSADTVAITIDRDGIVAWGSVPEVDLSLQLYYSDTVDYEVLSTEKTKDGLTILYL